MRPVPQVLWAASLLLIASQPTSAQEQDTVPPRIEVEGVVGTNIPIELCDTTSERPICQIQIPGAPPAYATPEFEVYAKRASCWGSLTAMYGRCGNFDLPIFATLSELNLTELLFKLRDHILQKGHQVKFSGGVPGAITLTTEPTAYGTGTRFYQVKVAVQFCRDSGNDRLCSVFGSTALIQIVGQNSVSKPDPLTGELEGIIISHIRSAVRR